MEELKSTMCQGVRTDMSIFARKLENAIQTSNSLVCVGLDPDPAKMPVQDVYEFCRTIVDATSDYVAAVKPNMAFFEALGIDGLFSLKKVVEYVHHNHPNKLIIGDGKRGDIGSTSVKYASALFQYWNFDAVTVNVFGGRDSIQPFLDYKEKGVLIWCRSSNPDGFQVQGSSSDSQSSLFERIARMAVEWNQNGNVGLVVGATFPKELSIVRKLAPGIPILVPGIGSQKGDLENSLVAGAETGFPNLIISSSRSINYASDSPDRFGYAAGESAKYLKESINSILSVGKQ